MDWPSGTTCHVTYPCPLLAHLCVFPVTQGWSCIQVLQVLGFGYCKPLCHAAICMVHSAVQCDVEWRGSLVVESDPALWLLGVDWSRCSHKCTNKRYAIACLVLPVLFPAVMHLSFQIGGMEVGPGSVGVRWCTSTAAAALKAGPLCALKPKSM